MFLRAAESAAACPPLSLRVLRDPAALANVVPAWQELHAHCASPEPMLDSDWLLTWWRTYHDGRQLRVGLFFDGDRLVGLAPLHARRFWHHRIAPLRRLEFLGSDVDENDGVCSEHLNLLVRKGHEERVASAFVLGIVANRFGRWDELVLSRMDGDARMPGLLTEAFARFGLTGETTATTAAPFIGLPATWDEYLASLPSRKRRGLLKSLAAFESWAGADARFHAVRAAGDLEQGRRVLMELHQQRWQTDGQPGAFSSSRFTAFHDEYMPKLLEAGKLELFWLEVRGRAIAAHYNILANGKTYFYQSGRCTDVPEGINPGTVIMIRAIENAIQRGAREFDFLADPSQFKSQFTATARPLVQLRVARGGVREWFRRVSERAARRWRARRQQKTLGSSTP